MRVDDELAAWADEYAASRGVSRTALLESAIVSFRGDCEAGVPELRARARAQSQVREPEQGVGDCPRREGGLGHVWSRSDLERRPCVFCGVPGRGPGGFLDRATADRAELFARLRAPQSVKGSTRAEGRGAQG